jgi:hypothetical protein
MRIMREKTGIAAFGFKNTFSTGRPFAARA